MRWLSCFSGGTQRHRAQVLPLTADAFDQKYQPDPELDQPILSRETIIAGPVTPALKKTEPKIIRDEIKAILSGINVEKLDESCARFINYSSNPIIIVPSSSSAKALLHLVESSTPDASFADIDRSTFLTDVLETAAHTTALSALILLDLALWAVQRRLVAVTEAQLTRLLRSCQQQILTIETPDIRLLQCQVTMTAIATLHPAAGICGITVALLQSVDTMATLLPPDDEAACAKTKESYIDLLLALLQHLPANVDSSSVNLEFVRILTRELTPQCGAVLEALIGHLESAGPATTPEGTIESLACFHIFHTAFKKFNVSNLPALFVYFGSYLTKLRTLLLFLLNKFIATMEASVDGDASEIDTLLLAIASYLAEVLFWTQRQLQVSGSAVAVDGMYLQSLCQILSRFVSCVARAEVAAVSAAVSSVGASPASQVPNTGPAHLQSPFDHIGALTSSSAFAIGDAVDGKCETNNGSYRWFPGVVLCLHEDGTVDVEYSDGDKHLHKSMDGIRPTRRRSDENTMQPQPAPITSTAVTAPHPVAVTSSSLIHQADSNVSNDYVSVMSSDSESPRGSEESDNVFEIPSALESNADTRSSLIPRTTAPVSSNSKVPPIALNSPMILATLNISTSNQSLSSYLISNENKTSRSTRLISFREDHSETSGSKSKIPLGRLKGSIGTNPIDILVEDPLALSSPLKEDASVRQLSMLASKIVPTVAIVAAIVFQSLIHTVAKMQSSFFIIREFLSICPIPELNAYYKLFSKCESPHLEMLKLLSPYFLHPLYATLVDNGRKLGEGFFGSVVQVDALFDERKLVFAVKRLSRERVASDPCRLLDVLNEIRCMKALAGTFAGPILYDYGVNLSGEEYWICMERGHTSLSQWRASITVDASGLMRILRVYKQVLAAVQILHSKNLVHFDIKCDNILLRSQSLESTENVLFFVDFGESLLLEDEDINLGRSRGTLPIQSPEMVAINAAGEGHTFDNPSFTSDVWSCGCLLGELLMGRHLFADKSWMDLYMLLCVGDFHLDTSPIKLALLEFTDNPVFCDDILSLLQSILLIQPNFRPPLRAILDMVQSLIQHNSIPSCEMEEASPNISPSHSGADHLHWLSSQALEERQGLDEIAASIPRNGLLLGVADVSISVTSLQSYRKGMNEYILDGSFENYCSN